MFDKLLSGLMGSTDEVCVAKQQEVLPNRTTIKQDCYTNKR